MAETHDFPARIVWTGNRGTGNTSYTGYDRTWEIRTPGKPPVACSNDPALGGDPTLHNPEDLLISALSSCHMLWFLHLAHRAKIIVSAYQDDPVGFGETAPNGAGRFTAAVLRPTITVAKGTDTLRADALHHDVHNYCFIARSVNFPVRYEPTYLFD